MNKAVGGMHSSTKVVSLKNETPAEIQKRAPLQFGGHQVRVLDTYLSRIHSEKFPSFVGSGVENFRSRREALDSGKRLCSG